MENSNQTFNSVDLVEQTIYKPQLSYICSACHIHKSSDCFHKDSTRPTGLNKYCKECRKQKQKQNPNPTDTATCSACHIQKSREFFHRDKTQKNGLQKYCIDCRNQKLDERKSTAVKPIDPPKPKPTLKSCTKCHEEKTLENFRSTTRNGKPEIIAKCKECEKQYNKERRKPVGTFLPTTVSSGQLKCSTCKLMKSENDFHKDSTLTLECRHRSF